jgi:hypothetical protein
LNELGLEGQLRHWYLIPTIGCEERASSEVVARGNMQEDTNIATRIADFQVNIVLLYPRVNVIGVQNCACGNGRDAART